MINITEELKSIVDIDNIKNKLAAYIEEKTLIIKEDESIFSISKYDENNYKYKLNEEEKIENRDFLFNDNFPIFYNDLLKDKFNVFID